MLANESVEEPSRSHLVGNYVIVRHILVLSLAIPLRKRLEHPRHHRVGGMPLGFQMRQTDVSDKRTRKQSERAIIGLFNNRALKF